MSKLCLASHGDFPSAFTPKEILKCLDFAFTAYISINEMRFVQYFSKCTLLGACADEFMGLASAFMAVPLLSSGYCGAYRTNAETTALRMFGNVQEQYQFVFEMPPDKCMSTVMSMSSLTDTMLLAAHLFIDCFVLESTITSHAVMYPHRPGNYDDYLRVKTRMRELVMGNTLEGALSPDILLGVWQRMKPVLILLMSFIHAISPVPAPSVAASADSAVTPIWQGLQSSDLKLDTVLLLHQAIYYSYPAEEWRSTFTAKLRALIKGKNTSILCEELKKNITVFEDVECQGVKMTDHIARRRFVLEILQTERVDSPIK